MEEGACSGVVLVIFGEAAVAVRESRARMRSWCRFRVGRSIASAKCAASTCAVTLDLLGRAVSVVADMLSLSMWPSIGWLGARMNGLDK